MARSIKGGFSRCTAAIGIICLLAGIGISVCAWILKGNFPNGIYYEITKMDIFGSSDETSGSVNIGDYWWGGIIYVIPGILGIAAGCSRNVVAMILYLIFNIICCIVSGVVVALCTAVAIAWVAVNVLLDQGDCMPSWSSPNQCSCTSGDITVKLTGGQCDDFQNVIVIVGAMIAMGALSSFLAFIASYISCCALCNQESHSTGVIISGGGGMYQQPTSMVQNNANFNYSATAPPPPTASWGNNPNQYNNAYPPPPYTPAAGDPNAQYGIAPGGNHMAYPINDKANLVSNEGL